MGAGGFLPTPPPILNRVKEIIQHASDEFDDTRKTAHTNVVTKKYIIINRNMYIYNFWMTGFRFSFSAVQLHMGMLAIILCQRHSQLRKNKELILHSAKKNGKATSCWVKQFRAPACVLCFKISDTFQ